MASRRLAVAPATPMGSCFVCGVGGELFPLPDGASAICRECAHRLGELLADRSPRYIANLFDLSAEVLDRDDETPWMSNRPEASSDPIGRQLSVVNEKLAAQAALDVAHELYSMQFVASAIAHGGNALVNAREVDMSLSSALAVIFDPRHAKPYVYERVRNALVSGEHPPSPGSW